MLIKELSLPILSIIKSIASLFIVKFNLFAILFTKFRCPLRSHGSGKLKLFSLDKVFNLIFSCINLVVLSLLSGLFKLFKIRCVLSGINLITCSSLLASSKEQPLQKGLLLTNITLPPLPNGAL